MNCQSCGMPMDKPEDHGGGRPDNPYCKYCADAQGNLLPRETVKQNMVQFYIQKMGKTPDEAAVEVDKIMATMPAWQTGAAPVSEPPVPPISEPITSQPEVGRPLDETEPEPSVPEPTAELPTTEAPSAPGVTGPTAPSVKSEEETPTT